MSSRDRSPSAGQVTPADAAAPRPADRNNQGNLVNKPPTREQHLDQPADGEPSGGQSATGRRRRRRRGRRRGQRPETNQPHPASAGTEPPADAVPAEPDPTEPEAGGARRKRRRRRGRRGRSGSGSGSGERTPAADKPTDGPATGDGPTAPTRGRQRPARHRRRTDGAAAPRQIRGRRRTRSGRIEEVSSGGLVIDETGGEVRGVLIGKHDRRGRLVWSLPKGHVELGETLEETAVREIEEETGVAAEVRYRLGEVDYWFMLHGEKIHKTVHHFLLRFVSGELCDRDREVVEVAWVPLDELPARLAHPDERRLIARVPELLSDRPAR